MAGGICNLIPILAWLAVVSDCIVFEDGLRHNECSVLKLI